MKLIWLVLAYALLWPVAALLLAAVITALLVNVLCMALWAAFDYPADYIEKQGYYRPNIPNLPW